MHNPHHKIGGFSVADHADTMCWPASDSAKALRPPCGAKRPDVAALGSRLPAEQHPDIAAALAHVGSVDASSSDLTVMPPTDQGRSSACTWHALPKCIEIVSGFRCSMHVGYSQTGEMTGDTADDGRQPVDCLTVARTYGIVPFEGPSPDGRNSDIWTAADTSAQPPNVCMPATPAEAALAKSFDPGNLTIDPKSTKLQSLLVASLIAGMPIYLGTQVGAAFEELDGTQVAQPDPANDTTGGGHALALVGHRTMSDGSVQFRVENSWGEGWDSSGECWASLAWVAACWELHPIQRPASSSKPTILQRIEQAIARLVP